MAIPSWPAGFPPPLRDGYSYTQPELLKRTPFALGNRTRPLYTDGSDTINVSVMLKAAQWARFQAWLRFDAANGASWFTMPIFAAGVAQVREVRMTGPVTYELVGKSSVRVVMPVETRTGTTMTAAEYADLLNGVTFEGLVQTLLVPSDDAVLLPIAGDPGPSVPIPYAGLYLPDGGRIALEGSDGRIADMELPPFTVFTGFIPRRLRVIGTDLGLLVYGLSSPNVTSVPANSGSRAIPVVVSDTVNLPLPAVGGIYTNTGGTFSYNAGGVTGTATVPPRTWWRDAVVTRINATNTDSAFEALAFVR